MCIKKPHWDRAMGSNRERERAAEWCLWPWNVLTALLVWLYRDCSNRSSAVSLHVEEVYSIQFTTPAKVAAMTVTLWCGNWSEGEGEHHSWCTFQSFTQAAINGWSDTRNYCHPLLVDYWTYREEVTVPEKLCNRTLQTIHKGQSMVLTKCNWEPESQFSGQDFSWHNSDRPKLQCVPNLWQLEKCWCHMKFPKDLQRGWPLTSSNFSLTAFPLLRITTVDSSHQESA